MASISVNFMREKVAGLYENKTWHDRVMKFMSDRQVTAIYYYALEHNKFEKGKPEGQYHQMTLTEYMANK